MKQRIELERSTVSNVRHTDSCNDLVVKSNALIRSKWTIESIWEPRLIARLAARVRPDDEDFKVYAMPITELVGKNANGKVYKDLARVIRNMMSRTITIYESDSREVIYNVFSMCAIDSKRGIIEICFHANLKPHYLNLHKRFTKYSLEEFLQLPSIYSQRIYEILKSWSDKIEVTISLEDLYKYLDVPPSFKKDFNNFRMRVLDKAHYDITNLTEFRFNWLPVRPGRRKVTAIQFIFNQGLFDKRQSDMASAEKEREIKDHSANQKAVIRCRDRLMKSGEMCNPKKSSRMCKFCVERKMNNIFRRSSETASDIGQWSEDLPSAGRPYPSTTAADVHAG
jgi:plasmid replication initiation protein